MNDFGQTKSLGGTPQPSSPNTEADDNACSRIQFLESQIEDLTAALALAKKERDHALNSSIPKQRKVSIPWTRLTGPGGLLL